MQRCPLLQYPVWMFSLVGIRDHQCRELTLAPLFAASLTPAAASVFSAGIETTIDAEEARRTKRVIRFFMLGWVKTSLEVWMPGYWNFENEHS